MDSKEIRAKLKAQRNQKFRSKSDAQINAHNTFAAQNKIRNQSEEHKQKVRDALERLKANPEEYAEWAAKQSARMQETVKTTKWKENFAKGIEQRQNNSDWIPNVKKALSKALTEEVVKSRGLALRAKHGRAVCSPYGEFDSVGSFKEATGFNWPDKLRLLPHLYYYKDVGPGEVKTQKVYYSPYGYYYKSTPLFEAACEAGCEIALAKNTHDTLGRPRKAKPVEAGNNPHSWFGKMVKRDPDNYYIKIEPKREWSLE